MLNRRSALANTILRKVLIAAVIAAWPMSAVSVVRASDRDVLQCRATESERQRAGLCGAHGCDCGLLKSECSASRKYINSNIGAGAGYQRELYAYEHDCLGIK
jgi:hypothetical protein